MEGAQALAAAAREGRTRAYAALALCIAVLGCNWPVMTVGLRSFSPLWMSSLRLSVAAVTLFLFEAVRRGVVAPARQDLPIVASVAVFRLALVSAIVFVALQFVPPGRSSILVYTAAIWAVPISGWRLRERVGPVPRTGARPGAERAECPAGPRSRPWSGGR